MSREILQDIKNLGSKAADYVMGKVEAYKIIHKKHTNLDRHLSADGLKLALSSHPGEVNQTLAKMKDTLEKRKEREGKEPEVPSNITMSKPNRKGISKLAFEYHGQKYGLEGKPDVKEFTEWITEYTKTAESCITCDGLMFPGEPAGACDDGLMHMTFECCPSGGFYAGHVDDKGKLKPLSFTTFDEPILFPQDDTDNS